MMIGDNFTLILLTSGYFLSNFCKKNNFCGRVVAKNYLVLVFLIILIKIYNLFLQIKNDLIESKNPNTTNNNYLYRGEL